METDQTEIAFQCAECRLGFTVTEESLDNAARETGGSKDDFCCPMCRGTRLIVFVTAPDE